MMNLVEKTVALLVSEEISIWHFCQRRDGPQFQYYMTADPTEVYFFETYTELIDAAYARIDPLLKPIPDPYRPVVMTPGE